VKSGLLRTIDGAYYKGKMSIEDDLVHVYEGETHIGELDINAPEGLNLYATVERDYYLRHADVAFLVVWQDTEES
jgi:hypothetical protein